MASWVPDEKVLAKVRRICESLPETTEKIAWGHPVWRARDRQFAAYERYKGKDALAFLVEVEMLDALVKAGPRFWDAGFRRGDSGWVCLEVSPRLDWKGEVTDLFKRSHAYVLACQGTAKKKASRKTGRAGAAKAARPKARAR